MVEPKTLVEAAELSDLELLRAMRIKVATEIDNGVPAHALAALMRQLAQISKEIQAAEATAKHEAAEEAGPAPDEPWDPEAI